MSYRAATRLAFIVALLATTAPPSSPKRVYLENWPDEALWPDVLAYGWEEEDLEPIPESELGGEA